MILGNKFWFYEIYSLINQFSATPADYIWTLPWNMKLTAFIVDSYTVAFYYEETYEMGGKTFHCLQWTSKQTYHIQVYTLFIANE